MIPVFFANGLSGPSMHRLQAANMNPAVLRPWAETDRNGQFTGRNYITVHRGRYSDDGKPVYENILTNAPTLLRLEDWKRIDTAARAAAQRKLQFWNDIYGANPFDIPNGMGTIAIGDTIVQGEAEAIVSMDPIRKSQRQRQTFETRMMPLPCIHSDGGFTLRQRAVSTQAGAPIDTAGIAMAGRAVGEKVEGLALGTAGTYKFGDGTVYGPLNHPARMTKVLTRPDAGGYTPTTTVNEVGNMLAMLRGEGYTGPFAMYWNSRWEEYMDRDYSTTYAMPTLRAQLRQIGGISKMGPLDFLSLPGATNFRILIIQLTEDVIQGVNGLSTTVVQWDEEGGFASSFKVLCINVPRLRTNVTGNKTGVVDGASA